MAEKKHPRLFGLIGKNIGYSFSRRFFAEKFQECELPHTYTNFDLDTVEEFSNLKERYPALSGCNVTIPYKQSILPFLDDLSDAAKQIGAVNCIAFTANQSIGHNTDVIGFEKTLDCFSLSEHCKALILGAGGASKAVQYVLQQKQIPFQAVARNPKIGQISFSEVTKEIVQDHLLIIQTTPVGTYPNVEDCVDFPYDSVTSQHIAIDLIYNPEQTKFLQKFLQKGAKTCNGALMLEAQALASWEIWQKTF